MRGDVVEIVSSLLGELDGFSQYKKIITVAATNLISEIDPAILSRFEEVIDFKLPDLEERKNLLKMKSVTSPIIFDVDWTRIASKTQNWSGRDLVERLLKTAIHTAILEEKNKIYTKDIEKIVINNTKEKKQSHYV